MILRFEDSVIEKEPNIYKIVSSSYLKRIYYYVIHSGFRESVNLAGWLHDFIETPSEEVLAIAREIPTGVDHDETVSNVLDWVHRNIVYTGDLGKWKQNEYWQAPDETLMALSGDCEDGAILIYTLARLKGVPTERLLIMAGDVVGGGHCWLAYRPKNYPLNWAFMDWCYWPNMSPVPNRTLYMVINTTISGEKLSYTDKKDTNYIKLWFAFNEDGAHISLINDFTKSLA